jgi:NAD-dependent deacetylase
VIFTGAGVSAESGVPTFRGAGGLWRSFRAEDLATPEAFARDPRLVWEWYGWRRDLIGGCEPNAAHRAIAELGSSRDGVTIATQNVDGLHAAAGSPQRALLELHGSIFRVRCTRCDWRADDRSTVDATSVETLPRCAVCGALARPDVVWFGESLDAAVLGAAFDASERADVCLVIGTSGVVHPAAGLAGITRRHGGAVIEVNPDRTPITSIATVSIRSGAVDAVPALLRTDD